MDPYHNKSYFWTFMTKPSSDERLYFNGTGKYLSWCIYTNETFRYGGKRLGRLLRIQSHTDPSLETSIDLKETNSQLYAYLLRHTTEPASASVLVHDATRNGLAAWNSLKSAYAMTEAHQIFDKKAELSSLHFTTVDEYSARYRCLLQELILAGATPALTEQIQTVWHALRRTGTLGHFLYNNQSKTYPSLEALFADIKNYEIAYSTPSASTPTPPSSHSVAAFSASKAKHRPQGGFKQQQQPKEHQPQKQHQQQNQQLQRTAEGRIAYCKVCKGRVGHWMDTCPNRVASTKHSQPQATSGPSKLHKKNGGHAMAATGTHNDEDDDGELTETFSKDHRS
jgi:hypothetical protein